MTSVTWTQVHRKRHMISRTWYRATGTTSIVAPALASHVRVSMVGAGLTGNTSPGAGAAFARSTTSGITPGEGFTVQVGDAAAASLSALKDSIFTRTTGSVVLTKAKGASGSGPGLASASVGDVKRDGGDRDVGNGVGGASAGDDADTFPLGFGGRGAAQNWAAGRGGGGQGALLVYDSGGGYTITLNCPAGHGEVCVEFFNRNPNISWPGYSP